MDWRTPESHEAALLRRLLTSEFPGRAEVAEQLAKARVREIDTDGSLEFASGSTSCAPVVHRVPVEARAEDRDGVLIHALLHVVHGKINELEFYKEDGSPIIHTPRAEEWQVTVTG